jgi:hypothetical protein
MSRNGWEPETPGVTMQRLKESENVGPLFDAKLNVKTMDHELYLAIEKHKPELLGLWQVSWRLDKYAKTGHAKSRQGASRMGAKLIPAAAYIRMSGQQRQKSPAEQRAEISKLATREPCAIIEWFTDEAITCRWQRKGVRNRPIGGTVELRLQAQFYGIVAQAS